MRPYPADGSESLAVIDDRRNLSCAVHLPLTHMLFRPTQYDQQMLLLC